MPVEARSERDNQFVRGHVVKTGHSERSRNYYNLSLGTSRALAEKPHTPVRRRSSTTGGPDGNPDRGGAQVLRRVVRQHGSSRPGCILHRGRRLPQHPAGAGHRQGGHRQHDRFGPAPWPARHRGIDFRVINIAANGPVVMTERVDVFKLPDKSFELPVMGTFEVSGGKINAWRDDFDMSQVTRRMG